MEAASVSRPAGATLARVHEPGRQWRPGRQTAALGPPFHHVRGNGGGNSIDGEPRLNEEIREREVRLIGPDGEQVGIVPLAEALQFARERDLDLVEVAPQARPVVARVMDYGKHKYQEAQKQKEARRRQSRIEVKEIKMRPKISLNDYQTKAGHVQRFLKDGAKVRATIMFRGREVTHPEIGQRLLDRLAEDMSELATIEASPTVDGRNMVMVLAPRRDRIKQAASEPAAAGS